MAEPVGPDLEALKEGHNSRILQLKPSRNSARQRAQRTRAKSWSRMLHSTTKPPPTQAGTAREAIPIALAPFVFHGRATVAPTRLRRSAAIE